jgi:glycyl-tRNA synthetase beta chain
MSTKNLLVELFVEELPPKALKKLGEAFSAVLFDTLKSQGLTSDNSRVTAYASPRRLAAHVTEVHTQAADKALSQKLMPVTVGFDAAGNATPALLKRLAALGADESAISKLKRENDGKADSLFLDIVQTGVQLVEGLQKALDEALAKLPIPKVMTYQLADGWSNVNFVRPAHGLVAMYGRDVISINTLGLQAGNTTYGHRFEAKGESINIKDADSYCEQLKTEGAVIASFDDRRDEIVRQLNAAAAKENLKPIEDDALLDEVTALVERPNILLGEFEAEYLEVPQECLILTMKANQKYFPLLDPNNKLTNKFLIVSNISPADPSAVIRGNERVVRPRLADAKFFFDQDRKRTLQSRISGLDKVVYHNKLGTQGERVERVSAIAKAIGQRLGGDVLADKADKAAQLAKTDLLTDMVGEFPELQGIMGRYYAQYEKISDDIAYAIEDHYKPRYAGDELPKNEVGVCVALADKLETLVGMFGIGNIPTGDKDPFALRRHALGILRIIAELKLKLGMEWILKTAINAFPKSVLQIEFQDKELVTPLWVKINSFFNERTTNYLKDFGYSPQEAEAVIYQSNPNEYMPRLEAIRKARLMFPNEFGQLANADKRARNILNKSGAQSEILLTDNNRLEQAEEKALLTKTRELRTEIDSLTARGQFEAALLLTVQISNPVTAFFDSVMVNAEDEELRLNRFRLLHEVTGLTNLVADLSKLAS